MNRLNRLMRYFQGMPGDRSFENYYGALIRERQDGVPSAAEARRDFEPVRRIMDKSTYF